MREEYITVLKERRTEIFEKKSRFIANVKNITSEEAAVEYLEGIKKLYWDATHNVYAYYIGGESVIQKCSDDGEPSGTAGVPVLEAIRKEGIEDVIVVVTRYFGGTLLGTGGLVRAYSRCAREGIIPAGVVKRILCSKVNMKLDYTLLGKLNSLIAESGYKTIEVNYADLVDIYVAIPVNNISKFNTQISELTAGSIHVTEVDKDYYIIKEAHK